VTGATGGIGRAVVHALAAHSMNLCLTGRDANRVLAAAHEVAWGGAEVLAHRADLRSTDDIRALAERVRSACGRLDVLLPGAGALRLGDVEAADGDDLDEQYEVNVRAPFLLTQALLPLLRASRGQVVFVNSTAALSPGPANAAYAATKQALSSLAASFR